MATFKNNPITLIGEQLHVGDKAPNFKVIGNDLSLVTLEDFKGKNKLISVIPSIDTGVCDTQTRHFNQQAHDLDNTVVLTISMDLPFAQRRWCGASGLDNVITLSDHLWADFGQKYGVLIEELRLLSRSVFVIDAHDTIQYVQYVQESSDHPNYDQALDALKSLSK